MTKFNLRIQQTIKNKLRIVLLTLAVFLSLNFILFTDGNNLNSTNDQNYYYSDTTTNCPCPEFDIQFKICEEIKEIIIKQIDNKEVHYYRTKSKCDSDTSYKIIEELVTDSCHKMANLILKNSRFVIITPFTNIDTLKKQNTKCKYGEVKAEIIKKGKDSSSLEIIEYYLNNVYHRDVVKYYYGKRIYKVCVDVTDENGQVKKCCKEYSYTKKYTIINGMTDKCGNKLEDNEYLISIIINQNQDLVIPKLSIENTTKTNTPEFYPNPNNGQFNLYTNEMYLNSTLSIYNSLGKNIFNSTIKESNTNINILNKVSGVHFIIIRNNKNEILYKSKVFIY